MVFCSILCCFVAKSLFLVIFTVFLQKEIAWRQIELKIVPVKKKLQISGMPYNHITICYDVKTFPTIRWYVPAIVNYVVKIFAYYTILHWPYQTKPQYLNNWVHAVNSLRYLLNWDIWVEATGKLSLQMTSCNLPPI